MRVVKTEINVYSFDDLKDNQELKEKVLNSLHDINLHHGWWEFIYDDIETIFKHFGIDTKVKGFDVGRGEYIRLERDSVNLNLFYDGYDSITEEFPTLSLPERPPKDEFFKEFAHDITLKMSEIIGRANGNNFHVRNETGEDDDNPKLIEWAEWMDHVATHLRDLSLKMLKDDYEYRSSEEAILDSIEANEYEFTNDGNIFQLATS